MPQPTSALLQEMKSRGDTLMNMTPESNSTAALTLLSFSIYISVAYLVGCLVKSGLFDGSTWSYTSV